MARILLCVLVLFVALPTTANARNVTGNPMATTLAKRGFDWWQSYGKTAVCPADKLTVEIAERDFGGLGYAEPGSCKVTLDRNIWKDAQGWPLDGYLIAMRADLCAVFWHELGHTGGVLHFNNGWLMDGRGLEHMTIPARCVKWANGR